MNLQDLPLNNNLNPFSKEIKPGISLFTAIKNRKETFEEALQTWITHDQIDEIIIVDWDSDETLIPLVQKYQNGKIFIAVVEDQPKWILSFAYNLAARLTSRTRILKIDADVKVLPGFFEKHILKPGHFFCGNWRIRRNDNEMHLNGMIYLQRDDFFAVNGYNEFIKFYGWDDSDLYQRLSSAGLNRNDFDLDTLYHIPHHNRTLFQDKPGYLRNIPEEERASFATFVNRYIGNTYGKWSQSHKMLQFSITHQNDHFIKCHQSNADENLITQSMIYEGETIAIRERIPLLGIEISNELLHQLSRDELVEFYNLCFLKKTDQNSSHLFEIIRKSDSGFSQLLQKTSDKELPDANSIITESTDSVRLKEIYASWSWKIGHGITKLISGLFFWKSKRS